MTNRDRWKVKKMGQPQPLLLFYFLSFETNIITKFETKICEKMSIQYTVPIFEPTTLKLESPSITTRPGLLPFDREKVSLNERLFVRNRCK